MKTVVVLRTSEPWFSENLDASVVQSIGYGVWQVQADVESAAFEQIKRFIASKWQTEKPYHYAYYQRHYSDEELSRSEFLQLIVDRVFEPAGEEMGTYYDDSKACDVCGAGRIQRSPLILDMHSIPRGTHICRTIAQEIVIDRKLYDLMNAHDLSGASLPPVLSSKSLSESGWYQLVVQSTVKIATPPSLFGVDPFDLSERYRCPQHHTLGLNLLSELYIEGKGDASDVSVTSQFIGYRQGLLVPFPLIVISHRFYQLLWRHKIKGFHAEIVHIV